MICDFSSTPITAQPVITCLMLTIETLQQGVIGDVLVPSLLTLNIVSLIRKRNIGNVIVAHLSIKYSSRNKFDSLIR